MHEYYLQTLALEKKKNLLRDDLTWIFQSIDQQQYFHHIQSIKVIFSSCLSRVFNIKCALYFARTVSHKETFRAWKYEVYDCNFEFGVLWMLSIRRSRKAKAFGWNLRWNHWRILRTWQLSFVSYPHPHNISDWETRHLAITINNNHENHYTCNSIIVSAILWLRRLAFFIIQLWWMAFKLWQNLLRFWQNLS